MSSTSASATISVLDKIFATHGLTETIVWDNGTQLTFAQFNKYCKSHAIEHIQSPPNHQQANGQAEKFVDTLKRALLKTKCVRRNGRINKTIPHHIQNKRPPKVQQKVSCRSIDGKNYPNN